MITKSEADLAWERIRREAEARIRLEAAHAVAEAKNRILPKLQEEFEAALLNKVILTLPESATWAGDRGQLLGA